MTQESMDPICVTCGKGTRQDAIALKHISIRGRVSGPVGRYVLQQEFENTENVPIEVLYTFPLNTQQTLEDFRVRINGETARSEMMKTADANREYEEAVLRGDFGAHLRADRPNVLTLSLGNLAPGETARVCLKLAELLEDRGGQVELRFPTVVGVRYVPGAPSGDGSGFGWSTPTDQVPDADWITPPIAPDGTTYTVSMQLELDEKGELQGMESPSHPIRTEKIPGGWRIQLATNEKANRDIVLRYRPPADWAQTAWYAGNNGEGAFLIRAEAPPEDVNQRLPLDVAFLIDHSGSMGGQKLESAKDAVKLCLRKLNKGDRFRLVKFESSPTEWKSGWEDFGDDSLKAADGWIGEIESAGGTEMLKGIQTALSAPIGAGRRGVLVVITDGEVSNEAAIAAFVERHATGFTLLLLGIDSTVNQHLFDQLTNAAKGWSEYVMPREPLAGKIGMLFERLYHRVLKGVQIEGLQVLTVCPSLPVLVAQGAPKRVLIQASGSPTDPLKVKLQFDEGVDQGAVNSLAMLEGGAAGALEKLAATMQVDELTRKYTQLRRIGQADLASEIQAHIEALGLNNRIGTPFTQWVAVMERAEPVEGQAQVRVVPVEKPAEWVMDVDFAAQRSHVSGSSPRVLYQMLDQPDRFRGARPIGKRMGDASYLTPTANGPTCFKIEEVFLRQEADGSIRSAAYPKSKMSRQTLLAIFSMLVAADEYQRDLAPFGKQMLNAFQYLTDHDGELNAGDLCLVLLLPDLLRDQKEISYVEAALSSLLLGASRSAQLHIGIGAAKRLLDLKHGWAKLERSVRRLAQHLPEDHILMST